MASRHSKRIIYILSISMMVLSVLTRIENILGAVSICALLGIAIIMPCYSWSKNPPTIKEIPITFCAWFISIYALVFSSYCQKQTVDDEKIIAVAMPILILLFGLNLISLLKAYDKHLLKTIGRVFLTLVIVCCFSFSWVCRSNVLLDFEKPQIMEATASDLTRRTNKGGVYYGVKLSFSGLDGENEKVYLRISHNQYSALHEGDIVQVAVGQGYWNIEHYTLL